MSVDSIVFGMEEAVSIVGLVSGVAVSAPDSHGALPADRRGGRGRVDDGAPSDVESANDQLAARLAVTLALFGTDKWLEAGNKAGLEASRHHNAGYPRWQAIASVER